MNKNIILFFIFCTLMFNVSAFGLLGIYGPQSYQDIDFVSTMNEETDMQTEMLYEDYYQAYLDGNFSKSTLYNLVGVTGFLDQEFTDLDSMSLEELRELDDILIKNSYINPGDDTAISEYITVREAEQNKTYNKYLEYESLKNLQKENINKVWVHIISFTQLLVEILNIGVYLLGFYLFVFVVIEAVPNALIYMRDKILEKAVSKGRSR